MTREESEVEEEAGASGDEGLEPERKRPRNQPQVTKYFSQKVKPRGVSRGAKEARAKEVGAQEVGVKEVRQVGVKDAKQLGAKEVGAKSAEAQQASRFVTDKETKAEASSAVKAQPVKEPKAEGLRAEGVSARAKAAAAAELRVKERRGRGAKKDAEGTDTEDEEEADPENEEPEGEEEEEKEAEDADVEEGAELLNLLSHVSNNAEKAQVQQPSGSTAPQLKKEEDSIFHSAPLLSRSTPRGMGPGPLDIANGAWEPSCHDGLLTYHDGRKRWYHCVQCEYFNDRLYHSKMHYERIHVKQGKAMARKRKYVEPAGSVSGDGASLPPSSLQQSEPKASRVRQPGDKWLKTMGGTDSSTSGFRYQSVRERQNTSADDSNSSDEESFPPLSPSDEELLTSEEMDERAEDLQLTAEEKKLWCWEPEEKSIRRGVIRGTVEESFRPIYVFQDNLEIESPSSKSKSQNSPENKKKVLPLSSAGKQLRWWWYRKGGDQGTKDNESASEMDEDSERDPSSSPNKHKSSSGALGPGNVRANGHVKTAEAANGSPKKMNGGTGLSANGNGHADSYSAAPSVVDFQAVARGPDPDKIAAGKGKASFSSVAGGGQAGKAKRKWRRWDAEEEKKLADAIQKMGTKDWGAIHQEMGTDRSIKQLQDHWNDTKHDRRNARSS